MTASGRPRRVSGAGRSRTDIFRERSPDRSRFA